MELQLQEIREQQKATWNKFSPDGENGMISLWNF